MKYTMKDLAMMSCHFFVDKKSVNHEEKSSVESTAKQLNHGCGGGILADITPPRVVGK